MSADKNALRLVYASIGILVSTLTLADVRPPSPPSASPEESATGQPLRNKPPSSPPSVLPTGSPTLPIAPQDDIPPPPPDDTTSDGIVMSGQASREYPPTPSAEINTEGGVGDHAGEISIDTERNKPGRSAASHHAKPAQASKSPIHWEIDQPKDTEKKNKKVIDIRTKEVVEPFFPDD